MAWDEDIDTEDTEKPKKKDPPADQELQGRLESNLRAIQESLRAGGGIPEKEFEALWAALGPVVGRKVSDFLECTLPDWGLNQAQVFREDIVSYLREQFHDAKALCAYNFDLRCRRKISNFYAQRFRWKLPGWLKLEENEKRFYELKWRNVSKDWVKKKRCALRKDLARLKKHRPLDDATGKKIRDLEEALLMYKRSRGEFSVASLDDLEYQEQVATKSRYGNPREHNPDFVSEPIYEFGDGNLDRGAVTMQKDSDPQKTRRGNVEVKDILHTVFRAVDSLEEEDQMIIVLSFLYGLNDKEISEEISDEIPEENPEEMKRSHARVRQRKCQALKKVNKSLQQQYPNLVENARTILQKARENKILKFSGEDIACIADETARKIAAMYFQEKKSLAEIAAQLQMEESGVRELWLSTFSAIVDSRKIRAGARRTTTMDWDKVEDAELECLSGHVSSYIDLLPYGMIMQPGCGRVRGESERKTAALFGELKATADLLYLCYHPFARPPRDLRRLFNESVHVLSVKPEAVLRELGLTPDVFDEYLDGNKVIDSDLAQRLAKALKIDPEDIFAATLATIAAGTRL